MRDCAVEWVRMTQISTDDVRRLAMLSSLQLSDDEAEGLKSDLSSILTYIEQLSELDTTGVEPTYQVTDLENITRYDEVEDHAADRSALLALASEVENNSVKVPKVL